MTEEFNFREAVRGVQTLYMRCRMQENLKKRVPNRRALPRQAGLDGAS